MSMSVVSELHLLAPPPLCHAAAPPGDSLLHSLCGRREEQEEHLRHLGGRSQQVSGLERDFQVSGEEEEEQQQREVGGKTSELRLLLYSKTEERQTTM